MPTCACCCWPRAPSCSPAWASAPRCVRRLVDGGAVVIAYDSLGDLPPTAPGAGQVLSTRREVIDGLVELAGWAVGAGQLQGSTGLVAMESARAQVEVVPAAPVRDRGRADRGRLPARRRPGGRDLPWPPRPRRRRCRYDRVRHAGCGTARLGPAELSGVAVHDLPRRRRLRRAPRGRLRRRLRRGDLAHHAAVPVVVHTCPGAQRVRPHLARGRGRPAACRIRRAHVLLAPARRARLPHRRRRRGRRAAGAPRSNRRSPRRSALSAAPGGRRRPPWCAGEPTAPAGSRTARRSTGHRGAADPMAAHRQPRSSGVFIAIVACLAGVVLTPIVSPITNEDDRSSAVAGGAPGGAGDSLQGGDTAMPSTEGDGLVADPSAAADGGSADGGTATAPGRSGRATPSGDGGPASPTGQNPGGGQQDATGATGGAVTGPVRGVSGDTIKIGLAVAESGPIEAVAQIGDTEGHLRSVLAGWEKAGLVPVHGAEDRTRRAHLRPAQRGRAAIGVRRLCAGRRRVHGAGADWCSWSAPSAWPESSRSP